MYRWWVFLHIVGVLGFSLSHGVSAFVSFRLRTEHNRGRIEALLGLSASSIIAMYVALLLLLAGGVLAGFGGNWWTQRWIWVSLGLLIVVMGLMYALATTYYRNVREAIKMRPSGAPMVSDEELASILMSPRPFVVAAVGAIGLLAILYLMIFKPF